MRKTALVLVALAVLGGVAFLLLATLDQSDAVVRTSAAAPREETPGEERSRPRLPGALEVEDGVARAPDFDAIQAGDGRFVWLGRAVTSTGESAVRAQVVVETLDGNRAWPQPGTREGGYFVAIVEEKQLAGDLRIVVTAGDESGIAAAGLDAEEAVDVGTIDMRGSHAVEGTTSDGRNMPVKGAHLELRRFGELALLPSPIATATSDDNGEFSMQRLPAGLYAIEGTDPEGRRFLRAPVVVPGPRLSLGPIPARDFPFVVRNTLNEPVGQAIVALRPAGDARRNPLGRAAIMQPMFAVTQVSGAGHIAQLPPGDYDVDVRVGSAAFERRYTHARRAPGRDRQAHVFRIATDLMVSLRLVDESLKALPDEAVRLELRGDGAPMILRLTSDADGVVRVPRLGARGLHITAETATRRGVLPLGIVIEGSRPEPLMLRRVVAEEEPRERTAFVQTVGGEPVLGARVYVVSARGKGPTHKTGADGTAIAGKADDDAALRLFRPDLANGDPGVAPIGGLDRVPIVWKPGRPLALRVRDAQDGFAIGSARIFPNPRAWTRTGPGEFEALWDNDQGGEIVVRVDGYEPWKADVGAATEIEVPLVRAGESLARLQVEVRSASGGQPGIWVSGSVQVPTDEGRRKFTAITGPGGVAVIAGLAPGPWLVRVDAGSEGGKVWPLTLGYGINRFSLRYDRAGSVAGRVIDRWKRGIAGVTITTDDLDLPVAVTDAQGRFVLNVGPPSAKQHAFTAKKTGVGSATFAVKAKARRKPIEVLLEPACALNAIVSWEDGRAQPVPDDIEMSIQVEHGAVSAGWGEVGIARMRRGQLVAEGLPAGNLLFIPLRGSALIRPFGLKLKPGEVKRMRLRAMNGGIVEGRVTRAGKPAGNVVLFLAQRNMAPRPVRSDTSGEFTLRGLMPGTYAVRAHGQTPESADRNGALLVEARRVTTGVLVELR